jgi:hypothetical protein
LCLNPEPDHHLEQPLPRHAKLACGAAPVAAGACERDLDARRSHSAPACSSRSVVSAVAPVIAAGRSGQARFERLEEM